MSSASPRRSPSPRPPDHSNPHVYHHPSPRAHSSRSRLQRQFSTTKNDRPAKVYPKHSSRSYESANPHHHVQFKEQEHHRNNSYPTRRNRAAASAKAINNSMPLGATASKLEAGQRRMRPRPPPLNISSIRWDSEQTSETDCSVASSSSTNRSNSACSSPIHSSPSNSPSCKTTELLYKSSSPGGPSPGRSPRGNNSSSTYFSLPPLSPIPHSPQPSVTPTNLLMRDGLINSPCLSPRTPPAPGSSPRSPCSPFSPGPYPNQFSSCQSPGGQRSPSPGYVGNLARLASRRRSNAVFGMRRRTSNFLELPLSDYERKRRYCSLPEHGYNPRHSNEIYRLRAFSISPKGALIKHGDHMASRRSRSSAGSTANTSRQASRSPSRGASHSNSRDVSPMAKSPVGNGSTKSPWSSRQSFVEDDSNGTRNNGTEDDEYEVEEDEVKYRVTILGHNESGKTALVNQFLTSEYMNTYDASLDEEFGERSVSVVLDSEESELVFIDHTWGEMSVENTLSTYDPHACVIVYSVVDRKSFHVAEDLLGYLWKTNYTNTGNASVILVGNKVDLERSRNISQEEGKKLAMSYGAKFIETSAGIQHNVDELLVGVLKQIRLRQNCHGKDKRKAKSNLSPSAHKALSSPLHTLQVAREILSKVCLSPKHPSLSKSCENLHVL